MSQELRNERDGERDISWTPAENDERRNYESFEGMNYEQLRQPFNSKFKPERNVKDERRDSSRPDES